MLNGLHTWARVLVVPLTAREDPERHQCRRGSNNH